MLVVVAAKLVSVENNDARLNDFECYDSDRENEVNTKICPYLPTLNERRIKRLRQQHVLTG